MSNEDATETEADATAEETSATDEGQDTQEESDLNEVDRDKALAWSPEEARRKISKINNEIRATKARLSQAPKAEDVAAKDSRIGELESAALRYEVALDLGLPKEIASRLQGKDRDEMVADAEKLLELLAPAKRPATRRPAEALRGGLQPDAEPEETDPNKIAARMFRN